PSDADVRTAGLLRSRMGRRRPRAARRHSLLRARHGREGRRGLRACARRDRDHGRPPVRRAATLGRALPSARMTSDDRFRRAAQAYVGYGIVYWIGGLWLLSQGVGVMGGRTAGATGASMARWGLIGLVPLVVIPWLLS